jgi:DNA-binding FadR family transcriptional regulator
MARPSEVDMATETAMLRILDRATGPVGAREIRHGLLADGHQLSEATVSRRLRQLDATGITVAVERKGRMLTEQGAQLLRSRMRGREQADMLDRAIDIRTGADVLHLLRARRAVEPEAVRGGVGHADPAVLAELRRRIDEHGRALDESEHIPRALVLDFHRTVTSFTTNPLITAMTRIALDPQLDRVEQTLDVILETRHTSHESIAEHARIVDAMAEGDAEGAAGAMADHLDRLISEAAAFMARYDSTLIDRLLAAAH